MNTLETKIQGDLVSAMKGHQENAVAALRSVKTAIQNEKVKGAYHELTDGEILDIIRKLVKQRKESMEIYSQAGRDELADKEQQEMFVLNGYLPAEMTPEEVEDEVRTIIRETGASSMKDMGKVMGIATARLKGMTDGKVISGIVKKLLSN